MTIANSKQPSF